MLVTSSIPECDLIFPLDKATDIKRECESQLKEVLPVLQEAENALSILNKTDVYEIKSMKSPPQVRRAFHI